MITPKDKIGYIWRKRYDGEKDEFKLIVAEVIKIIMTKKKTSVYTKEFYPFEMEEIESNTSFINKARGLVIVGEPFLIKDEDIEYFQAVVKDFNENGTKSVWDWGGRMNKEERSKFAYQHRDLVPYERINKAEEYMYKAMALLEDEVWMQNYYSCMDYSTLPTGHYKDTINELKGAIKILQHESRFQKRKEIPKGTLSKKKTIEYLLAIDDFFCIEPSVMRNAIYSACNYLKERQKVE